MPGEKADDVLEVRPVAEGSQQRRNVYLSDHHAAENHELPAWRPDTGEVVAELAAVERNGPEGATADRGPRKVFVVRMDRRRREPHAGLLLEIIENDRTRLKEGRSEERRVGKK